MGLLTTHHVCPIFNALWHMITVARRTTTHICEHTTSKLKGKFKCKGLRIQTSIPRRRFCMQRADWAVNPIRKWAFKAQNYGCSDPPAPPPSLYWRVYGIVYMRTVSSLMCDSALICEKEFYYFGRPIVGASQSKTDPSVAPFFIWISNISFLLQPLFTTTECFLRPCQTKFGRRENCRTLRWPATQWAFNKRIKSSLPSILPPQKIPCLCQIFSF